MRRYFNTEIRAKGDDSPKIEGFSTLFDVKSPNWEGFVEVVHRGFFDDVLEDDVVAMWEHDSRYPLAGVRNGTLSLTVDEKGVKYAFEPTQTTYSRDLLTNVRSGLVNQSSFGFMVKSEGGQSWEELEDGTVVRHLIKASKWLDVSPVTHAYYPETTVIARNIRQEYDQFMETRKKTSYHDWIDYELRLMELDINKHKTVEI